MILRTCLPNINKKSKHNSVNKTLQNPEIQSALGQNGKIVQALSTVKYFSKVHNSLSILQKKQSKSFGLIHFNLGNQQNSLNNHQIGFLQHKRVLTQPKQTGRSLKSKKSQLGNKLHISIQKDKQIPIKSQQQRMIQNQKKKKQLIDKTMKGIYSFDAYNNGEVFEQICDLNQLQRVQKAKGLDKYRVTQFGVYTTQIRKGIKANRRIKSQMEERFKEEYNLFMRSKLPLSFGQGPHQNIYEKYIQKQSESKKKFKIQPQKIIFGQSLNSLQIKQIEKIYETKIYNQEKEKLASKKVSTKISSRKPQLQSQQIDVKSAKAKSRYGKLYTESNQQSSELQIKLKLQYQSLASKKQMRNNQINKIKVNKKAKNITPQTIYPQFQKPVLKLRNLLNIKGENLQQQEKQIQMQCFLNQNKLLKKNIKIIKRKNENTKIGDIPWKISLKV